MIIDNELLAAYAEGNVSQEEREAVRLYLADNPDMMESVLFAMENTSYDNDDDTLRYDNYIENLGAMVDDVESSSPCGTLPLTAMAAQNIIDNICVVRCEGIALRHFGFNISDEILHEQSQKEGWQRAEGTALHNIGRLAGSYGLGVSHRYECTIDDISEVLSANNVVLAAVDANELIGNYAAEKQKDIYDGKTPNHVVIVESVNQDTITITDTATPQQHDVYPLTQFLDAWDDSSRYMIIISDGEEYEPHPIDLADVEISDDLIELREAIAENAHEVWAYNRKQEGWTYGPERDDAKKLHPDMIAYNRLPESEKLYDREMAMNTIKLLKKLGWELKKTETVKVCAPKKIARNDFSDIERRAIVTLILKLFCVDSKISSDELFARSEIYNRIGITHEHEHSLVTYEQASLIYKNMSIEKREIIKDLLHELSLADGDFHNKENDFLEKLEN